jgi:nucleotide-binding universal stress UspA family protein
LTKAIATFLVVTGMFHSAPVLADVSSEPSQKATERALTTALWVGTAGLVGYLGLHTVLYIVPDRIRMMGAQGLWHGYLTDIPSHPRRGAYGKKHGRHVNT